MKKLTVIVLFLVMGCKPSVQISDNIISEGQDSFKITTATATYIYQKSAGGFSNIFDDTGRDWIQFHKSDSASYPSSSASDYRGLPNLVFKSDDGGCGHPGFEKMVSEKVAFNQIRSISKSGKWQWLWTFHPSHAELKVEKVDVSKPYWFLYEGPTAGKFSPKTHYWGNNLSEGPSEIKPDLVNKNAHYGSWQVAYFGDKMHNRTLFLKQAKADSLTDLFTYMGNTLEGNTSSDGMTVFGFGRAVGATPLLKNENTFIIGFYGKTINDNIRHKQLLDYLTQL